MIVSLGSYIIAFVIFAFSDSYAPLFVAIFFYSIGEAFRTGTHKAMIFDWLRINDRLGEKTKVYGFTRSWSKYGSAVSVIISAMIRHHVEGLPLDIHFFYHPLHAGNMEHSGISLILNKKLENKVNIGFIFTHTFRSIKTSFTNMHLRKLIIQSMGFEGVFEVTKDYLQPYSRHRRLRWQYT
jgi:MFS family permease